MASRASRPDWGLPVMAKATARLSATTGDGACATIKQAGEAIITIDERQDIQVFNRAAEDLFGFSEDAAQEMNLDDLIPELHRAAHRRHVAKFLGSSEGIQSMNVPG